VNHLGTYGRWAFAEFTEVYQIESDFKAKVESEFNKQPRMAAAEINEDAWATLNSDTSRPFEKPKSGRIAVKVINHLGDEVMKVFKV
jgi:hypothetical protein